MKKLALLAAFICLGGCDRDAAPLIAYRHPIDALAKTIPPMQLFGVYPCASKVERAGITTIIGVPIDQCYKMLPAQRFRGIWLDEYEGSAFYENAENAAAVKAEYRREWASPDHRREALYWSDRPAETLLRDGNKSRMIALDFIGRRTAYPGRYGHMGVARSAVIVDRVISSREMYRARTTYLYRDLGLSY